ncbi:uncharacterized protein LOC114467552 isoform X1 [Gouania willdenowi]|uniref:uncharacterized protein LOC114467552 isoform X1 n=1 Tax=Gouania willdenowi TaxID=441366 RepID=UPI001054304B|nr:uncharacterized protein LOC114467552 isoform X1 [Gouania willdenowi]
MSSCPTIDVLIGGVSVSCLVDTGSMVSTMTEQFFLEKFAPWGQERLQSCHWLQLRAANGLAIPYIGYLELEVELCGQVIPSCGILVVRDPPAPVSSATGILGMNINRRCYRELFGGCGPALFESHLLAEAPGPVRKALQQCHRVDGQAPSDFHGTIRVCGKKAVRIPGGFMKLVASTCPEQFAGQNALFEPTESGLPAGLLASPSLIQVIRGTAYIPVVNVGTTEVLLYPRTSFGTLSRAQVVSLPAGVTKVQATMATVSSQTVSDPVPDRVDALDLSTVGEGERSEVRALLRKYSSVFSAHEGDMGCTHLISHDIPLLDDVPLRQRYRRIPPSEYEAVKAHINQLLESQVIRESSSPYASPIVLVRKKDGTLTVVRGLPPS